MSGHSSDLLDKLRVGFGKIAQIHSRLVGEEKREVGENTKTILTTLKAWRVYPIIDY